MPEPPDFVDIPVDADSLSALLSATHEDGRLNGPQDQFQDLPAQLNTT